MKRLVSCIALAAAAAGAQETLGTGSPAVGSPGGIAAAAETPKHVIQLSGYAILNGAWTQSDPSVVTIGRNNGFALGNARIELTGKPADSLWLFISLDGAVSVIGADPTAGRQTVELKDAYGVWAPTTHLRLQAGQFKAPQDVEELLSDTELKFVSRSIVSNGVRVPFGYAAAGLGLDRQIGVGFGTDRVETGLGGLITQIAVTNGNGANQFLNDTPYPSVIGRAALDMMGRTLSFGLDAYFQPRGSGVQPSYFRDNLVGGGADVRYESGPLHVMLLAQMRNTHHVTTQQKDELSYGVSGEGAWKLDGWFEPALRVSTLEPSNQVADDSVLNATAGVNFYVPNAPARLSVDFTHRIEQADHELDNDSIEIAAQVRF
jgi:hypothetical protein